MSKKAKRAITTFSSVFGCFILGILLILKSRHQSYQSFSEVPLSLWVGYGLLFVAGTLLVTTHFLSHIKDNLRWLSRIWFTVMHLLAIYTLGMFCITMIADGFQFHITYENYWTVFPLKTRHDELVFLLKELTYAIGVMLTSFFAILYYGVMNAIKK